MLKLFLILLLFTPTEKVIGHNVQFFYTKDHKLIPVLPVSFEIVQEEGGIPEGVIACDTVARLAPESNGQYVTILKCKNGVTFKVAKVDFTESSK